jgi:hypothetical protein
MVNTHCAVSTSGDADATTWIVNREFWLLLLSASSLDGEVNG